MILQNYLPVRCEPPILPLLNKDTVLASKLNSLLKVYGHFHGDSTAFEPSFGFTSKAFSYTFKFGPHALGGPYTFIDRILYYRICPSSTSSVVTDGDVRIILDKKLLTEELQNIKQNWINLKKVSSLYGNELQDCLVSSGRLIEALETLEDWLIRVEPDLAEVKVSFRSTSGFNYIF